MITRRFALTAKIAASIIIFLSAASVYAQERNVKPAAVTVLVYDGETKAAVGGASVTLDGPGNHSNTTNAEGKATLIVPEAGTFVVRISQDNYKPFRDEIRLVEGQSYRNFTFELESKAIKDQGEDKIDVTVLARDPTDKKAKPSPLSGAHVRAGRIGATTDSNGQALLEGAFEEKQDVTAESNGYKPQTKTVRVARPRRYSAGSGRATFTLDPESSESRGGQQSQPTKPDRRLKSSQFPRP